MCKFWDDEYSILPVSVYEDAINIRNGKGTRDQCTQVDPDLQAGSIGDNFAQDKITRNQYTQVDSDLMETEIGSFCQVELNKTVFQNSDNENQVEFLSLNTNEKDFEEENEQVLESSPYPFEMNQSDEVEILLGVPSFNHDNTRSSVRQTTQSIYACDEFAKNKDSNENHSKIKSGLQDSEILPKDERPFSCNVCGMKYKLNHHFKRHRESCRLDKLLTQAKTRKSSGKYTLSTKKTNNQLELEKHRSSTSREKKYQCETCGKLCYTSTNLKTHKMTHTGEKPFKCRFCSYSSNIKGAVVWHERTHTDERPFQCDTCGKTFKLKCHLEQHVATHFDARPFKCEQCDATFRRNSALLLHRKTHTEEKTFSCHECDSTFRLKKELVKHQILHLTDNPLTCNVCGSIFLLKQQLKQHLKSHQDLPKPFECHFCFKTFKHNCQLSQHLRGHSNDKPFKCQRCSSAFASKANLRRHELGHLKKLDKVTARNLNYDDPLSNV